MQDQLFNMLLEENEITWQSIIYNLVKTEQMNPWDIDVSLLTNRYIEAIKELEMADFFLSGKVLLASAILLKIKSVKLVDEDIANFDHYLFHSDEELENPEDFISTQRPTVNAPPLGIKTPQARKRKVSVKDLISALEKALEVNQRRIIRREAFLNYDKPVIPEKKVDITALIKNVFDKIKSFFNKGESITFTKLVPSNEKKDKIYTFVPLLHLSNQSKIDMEQKEHFGEIEVFLKNN